MRCFAINAASASIRSVIFLTFFVFVVLACTAQEPSFHAQTNVVLVPALVLDKQGQPVYGLHEKDFAIEDDGVAQAIHLDEEAEPQPISLIIVVQTGRKAYRESERMKGLASMLEPILSQDDTQAAVVTFDSQPTMAQDFTNDSDLIFRALQNISSGDNGAAILDAVNYAAGMLNKVPEGRQRVLLLISETRDHGSRYANVDGVVQRIASSNESVYALSFSPGLSNILDTGRGTNRDEMGPGPDILGALYEARQAMRRNTPQAIASLSGGEYELFPTRKAFEGRMLDFGNHLHSRYLLSFEPKDPHPGLHRVKAAHAFW